MILVDREILVFLQNGNLPDSNQTAIINGTEDCVTNLGYDLRTHLFAKNGKMVGFCELNPGESVFVESQEIVQFDNNTCGRLSLKNSRIRMGLTMDAPLYQPGHKTRIFFRLTNISDNVLTLSAPEKYAMLTFEQLHTAPDNPYSGTFQHEFSFQGLADYESKYADQITSLDGKLRDIKALEKSIYSNVITILSVFVAVFTLLNVNITMAYEAATEATFLTFNLSALGSASFLSILLHELVNKSERKQRWLWLIPAICFLVVIFLVITT